MAEQWLLQAGVVTESTIDTLLMYAYVEPSVAHVTLEIDRDDANNGAHPKVTYKVRLHYADFIKLKAIEKIRQRATSLFNKALLLTIAAMGGSLHLKQQIINRAQEYLPPQYAVEVIITNE